MDQPNIPRTRLIEILLADEPWSPAMLDPASRGGDPVIWQHIRSDLAEVQADRLLNPSWTGYLLDRPTVREKMVAVGMTLGAFQIPGMPIRVTVSIAGAIADLQLVLGPVDFAQTHARAWERVKAIVAAAQMFGTQPVTFLTDVEEAQDWILRLSTTSEEFRVHQRERIDAKHPQAVDPCIQVLHESIRQEIATQLGRPNSVVNMFIDFPRGEHYWEVRARWLQVVEFQIARVWPGQALGAQRVPANDA